MFHGSVSPLVNISCRPPAPFIHRFYTKGKRKKEKKPNKNIQLFRTPLTPPPLPTSFLPSSIQRRHSLACIAICIELPTKIQASIDIISTFNVLQLRSELQLILCQTTVQISNHGIWRWL